MERDEYESVRGNDEGILVNDLEFLPPPIRLLLTRLLPSSMKETVRVYDNESKMNTLYTIICFLICISDTLNLKCTSGRHSGGELNS